MELTKASGKTGLKRRDLLRALKQISYYLNNEKNLSGSTQKIITETNQYLIFERREKRELQLLCKRAIQSLNGRNWFSSKRLAKAVELFKKEEGVSIGCNHCFTSPIGPGTNFLGSTVYGVKRCDYCKQYASDLEAAVIRGKALGGEAIFLGNDYFFHKVGALTELQKLKSKIYADSTPFIIKDEKILTWEPEKGLVFTVGVDKWKRLYSGYFEIDMRIEIKKQLHL